jgi:dCMP deaminase
MTVLVAYIPALHKGYIDFFKKYPDELFILGRDLVLEQPRMDRDIRAMDTKDIEKTIAALGIFKKITILSKKNLNELQKSKSEVVMPDEDVSHLFSATYLAKKKIRYIPVFLRWDKHSTQKTNVPVNPDRKISHAAFDKEMMKQAELLTKKSSDWWRNIGALVVKKKKIILAGYNHPLPNDQIHNILGDPRSNFDYGLSFELSKFLHAEAGVIAEAAKRGLSLDGASMYVTTFPCPVCAKSIATAGIKKVYYKEGYSLLDAEDILKSFGVELIQVA